LARPQKEGLDYFPLDTDMDLKDDKIQLVEAKYGITGFGVLIKLLMKIYSEGYYYQWGENEGLLFSKRVNVEINTVNDIVTDLVKWGMFDADIFKKYSVLTSNGIQKRFWEVAKRRNDVIIKKEFWVHDVDIILVSANINLINVDGGTQRKEKKRIVKESKEKNALEIAVDDFIEYRKKIRSPMTEHAIQLFLSKLNGLASSDETKIAIINQSIVQGWKGIFPLNADNKQQSKTPQKGNFEQRKYDDDYFDNLEKEV
jgi:hypothetical protein